MTEYRFAEERGWENLPELFPLYAQHYREMRERLERDGMTVPEFNPRIDAYVRAWQAGELLNYTVRTEVGDAVGYSNVYLALDMHNSTPIAQEDTIFVVPEHRNGVGRKLVKFILADLQKRGIQRVHVTAMTDLRVGKIWQRMGFKHTAEAMTYFFDEA